MFRYLLIIGSLFLTLCSTNAFASNSLVEVVQRESELERLEAVESIEHVFSSIKSALEKGEDVQIRNFGTFYLQNRKARKGINPKTREEIEIPARSYPKFRASENLKKLVRGE